MSPSNIQDPFKIFPHCSHQSRSCNDLLATYRQGPDSLRSYNTDRMVQVKVILQVWMLELEGNLRPIDDQNPWVYR